MHELLIYYANKVNECSVVTGANQSAWLSCAEVDCKVLIQKAV